MAKTLANNAHDENSKAVQNAEDMRLLLEDLAESFEELVKQRVRLAKLRKQLDRLDKDDAEIQTIKNSIAT